nr:tetratricopeptide repeat protein [Ruminiclostridium josui]
MFFLANSCDEGGRKEEAAEYYKKAAELEPYHFWAYNNLAAVYEEMGKYDKA